MAAIVICLPGLHMNTRIKLFELFIVGKGLSPLTIIFHNQNFKVCVSLLCKKGLHAAIQILGVILIRNNDCHERTLPIQIRCLVIARK